MTDYLQVLGIYTMLLSAIVACIIFIAKKIVETILKKDIENYKNELKKEQQKAEQEFSKEIENYKSELKKEQQKAEQEFSKEIAGFQSKLDLINIQQSQLYSKKREVIEELYGRLIAFNNAMIELTLKFQKTAGNAQEEEGQRISDASEKGNDFFSYYEKRRIYFDKETCSLIEKMFKILRKSHQDYSFSYRYAIPPSMQTLEMMQKAGEEIEKQLPPLKEKLESQFRESIGIV